MIPLRRYHLVKHLPDFLQRTHRRGERIDHQRVPSRLPIPFHHSRDDQVVKRHVLLV